MLFTDAAATELLATPGQADAIAVTADPGVSQADVAAAVRAAVGGDVEVITGAALIAEDQASMAELLAEMATIFVVFAVVAVFVGAFIINNTFSITVAQRTRQMAMLRAIGASGRQVKRSVLIEAAVIGVLASAAGLAAGVAVAAGLRQLMSVFGFDMPDGPTVIDPNAMILSFAVGVIVTVLSAWLPARRAARIAPIAALRDVSVDRSAGSVRRAVAGSVVTAVGVAALLAGLGGELALVGVGALATFAGVAVLGPVLARPVAKVFGLPLRLRGLSGELATRNATRNPKRTARTAASLMIGVALVGFMTVFAASAKTSMAGSLETEFTGTHIVQAGGSDTMSGLSPDLADELRTTPGVDVVSQSRMSRAVIDGSATDAFYAFDATTVDEVFVLGSVEGDLDSLGADGIAVSAEHAVEQGWTIGSTVPATFPSGDTTLVVEAIYTSGTDWVGSMFVDLDALRANGGDELDYRVYVSGDEAAIDSVAAAYPSADVLDKDAFLDVVSTEIDTMLGDVLRPADARRRHRPARHRQHAGAVDLRADPGARTAPSGRHGPVAGPFHGSLGVDHHRRVRHDPRVGHRYVLRLGDRPGDGRRGHRHPDRARRQPGGRHRHRRPRRSDGGGDASPSGSQARRAQRARHGMTINEQPPLSDLGGATSRKRDVASPRSARSGRGDHPPGLTRARSARSTRSRGRAGPVSGGR